MERGVLTEPVPRDVVGSRPRVHSGAQSSSLMQTMIPRRRTLMITAGQNSTTLLGKSDSVIEVSQRDARPTCKAKDASKLGQTTILKAKSSSESHMVVEKSTMNLSRAKS
jgi:hypothetical protein